MSKRVLDPNAPVNELLGKLKAEPPKPQEESLEPVKAETKPRKTPKGTAPKMPSKAPEGYKLNPQFIEKKTARLQLVLKQSTATALKAYCKENNVSVNDYVGTLIDKYLGE